MINGRFYFRQTQNGNLIGEFSNQNSTANTTESADLEKRHANNLTGDYKTTWYEQGENRSVHMDLRISLKPDSVGIFSLLWTDPTRASRPAFHGEAFLVDDLLIGNYWDEELQVRLSRITSGVK